MTQVLVNPINTAKNIVSFFQSKDNGRAKLTLLTISTIAFSFLAGEFLANVNKTLSLQARAKHIDLDFTYVNKDFLPDLEMQEIQRTIMKRPEIINTYPIYPVLGALVSLTTAVFSTTMIECMNHGSEESKKTCSFFRNCIMLIPLMETLPNFLYNHYKKII